MATTTTTTYDSNDVNVIVNGVITTGLGKSPAISASQTGDSFKTNIGMKGDVTLSEMNDSTGKITISLKSTSPSCAQYEELARRTGLSALVSVQVVDLTTNGISAGGTKCRIKKTSDKTWGEEETERKFEFEVTDYTTK